MQREEKERKRENKKKERPKVWRAMSHFKKKTKKTKTRNEDL